VCKIPAEDNIPLSMHPLFKIVPHCYNEESRRNDSLNKFMN